MVLDQHVPDVVADLVAEVADEGAMAFTEFDPGAFAFDRVGFFEVDGNQAVGVAGVDRVAVVEA